MPVEKLQQLNQHIAEVRLRIGDQHAIIQRFRDSGVKKDLAQAEAMLSTLEGSLRASEERKEALMRELRGPRASSASEEGGTGVKRRRRSAGCA
jgi:hypothetical protein